jgi:hypothetical protein
MTKYKNRADYMNGDLIECKCRISNSSCSIGSAIRSKIVDDIRITYAYRPYTKSVYCKNMLFYEYTNETQLTTSRFK